MHCKMKYWYFDLLSKKYVDNSKLQYASVFGWVLQTTYFIYTIIE